MPIQPFQPHYPFTDEKLAKLKQIVPEAFEDGRLNFDTLREVLEPNLDPEGTITDDGERFGLLWPGKKEARRLAAIPSKGTLAPVYGQGLKADGTPDTDGTNDSRNVFIEGENLEVLKIMQKAYANRVKMIYIDPPYNTGNDFVYDDNFTEPLEHYLRRTGQIDDEGQKLTTNTKADGRFHSKWLSMMYPRLRLARNLLREDGVIFVSIDDNEVHNLRQLMNEVFGEENLLGLFLWKRRQTTDSRNKNKVSIDHEYVIGFSRSEAGGLTGKMIDTDKYKNPDNDERGPWASIDLSGLANADQRPNLHYDLIDPATGNVYPPNPNRGWSKGPTTMQTLLDEGRILWPSKVTGRPREKKFMKDLRDMYTGFSTWLNSKRVGYTTDGTRDLAELFDNKIFDFPKPSKLIQEFLEQVIDDGDIVLDFFAGSGTTSQAVIDASVALERPAKFILVQLPEELDKKSIAFKSGYEKISLITIDRIKRTMAENDHDSIVKGVRSYMLESSQFNRETVDSLQSLFDQETKSKAYNPTTLLWEVALNEGFPLDSRVETREVAGQTIQTLTSEFHEFALHCCFDPSIAPAAAPEITLGENDVLVCLDSALDDQTKLRLSDKGLLKTI